MELCRSLSVEAVSALAAKTMEDLRAAEPTEGQKFHRKMFC
jgi:hypothetical protein